MGKFVLAIDSFKGCLSSAEVELAAERGIRAVDEKAEIVRLDFRKAESNYKLSIRDTLNSKTQTG